MKRLSWLVFGTILAMSPTLMQAEDAYPSKTISMVLPNAAGGSADATGRIIGNAITKLTQQAVLVQPKPGAAGNLAAAYVARSKPDGYTMFFAFDGTHGINANIYKHLEYSPMGDFKPVSLTWKAPFYLYVRKDAPFNTVKELIDFAKANPNKLSFGTAGKADPTNIQLLMFDNLAGIEITAVPYQGIAPAVQDVAAGRIDGAFATISTGIQFQQAGNVRILGETFDDVIPDYPDIPPISKTLPGFQFTTWDGIMVPAATPPSRIEEMNALIRKVLADPDVITGFRRLGFYTAPTTPEEMADFINTNTAKYGKVLKAAGIEPE